MLDQRALVPKLILVSWQSAHRWLSHKPSCRLPLLSASLTVNFPAKDWYQIILLGDRGTQVWVAYAKATTRWCPART